MQALTALLAALTVAALVPSPTHALHRLDTATAKPRGATGAGAGAFARSAGRRLGVIAAVVALGILISASIDPSVVVVIVTLGVITTVIVKQRARSVQRRAAATKRAAVIEACEVLAAEPQRRTPTSRRTGRRRHRLPGPRGRLRSSQTGRRRTRPP